MTKHHPSILAIGPGTWNWPQVSGSPRYHLWTLAGRGWPVVYVEPPHHFRMTPRHWEAEDRPFKVLGLPWVPPFAPRLSPTEGAANLWRSMVSKCILSAINRLMPLKDFPFVWLGAPWHGSLLPGFSGHKIVYHVYDELAESEALSLWQRQLLNRWESQLIKKADLVLCSSRPQQKNREAMAKRCELLENAVQDEFVEGTQKTGQETESLRTRIAALPMPRLIYGGVADQRLDPAMFQAALDALPNGEGSLIFLGTKSSRLDPSFDKMAAADNRVHFLGAVPYISFPTLYALADVLLIGHHRTPFTVAMYPEKLNEYLASGCPIVSVDLPEVERLSKDLPQGAVYLASEAGEFREAIQMALKDHDDALREDRKAAARRATWSARGDALETMLQEIANPLTAKE